MQPSQAELEPDVLHAEAVRDLIYNATGCPTYLGEDEIPADIPVPGFPYYVAWAAPGDPVAADERLAGYSGALVTRHQVTICALTPTQVISAGARARRALHRKRPTIPGRRCGDISQERGISTPTADPNVTGPQGQRIYVAFMTFTLDSTLTPTN